MVMSNVLRVMKTRVADPALRREVEAAVRRRVRGDEAEDVVQATLADVLSAAAVPEAPEEFRRFVFGVARNKVFDHFRRQKRQIAGLDESETAAPEPPLSARDILRWAEGELPDSESQSTLEWMLREGDGEKLEHIARDVKLPATRVRKRVSRLRKLLRDRWAAELMLAGLLALLCGIGALYWYSRGKNPDDFVKREPARPLPSAPRQVESSRPAGSAAPIPNFVAPSPSVAPAPSAVQSALPTYPLPVKQLRRARPSSTDDARNSLAPVVVGQKSKIAPPPSKLGTDSLDSEGLGLTGSKQLGSEGSGTGAIKRAASKPPAGLDTFVEPQQKK
jgi:DNA-directed RNA polymerase specialized sigma24 family protein